MNTDRLEKHVLLRAPLDRVWAALTDSLQFGLWFGVKFEQPFSPGTRLRGVIVPTTVDVQVAAMQRKFEGKTFEIVVDRIEPKRIFSFRWHPFAIDEGIDYTPEPMTLVEFLLKDSDEGVLLTVSESGYNRIPLERRAKAFAANDGGWSKQMDLIEAFVVDGL